MRLTRWNDTLAVQIPEEMVRSLDLKEGDEVTVSIAGIGSRQGEADDARQQALERIRTLKLILPPDWKLDRDEANAR